ERDFLLRHVVGRTPETGGVTYEDLGSAGAVLLAGFEPEEESPIVFLRLRKGFRKAGTKVHALAPFATRGLEKMGGTLVPTAPGTETEVLRALGEDGSEESLAAVREGLRGERAIILVGERLATVPGGLTAATRLAEATGARLAWVPRRAGERGAVEAGCLPRQGALETAGIISGAAAGTVGGLLVGGVDADDLGLRESHADIEQDFNVSL